jgi:hypothetical protein
MFSSAVWIGTRDVCRPVFHVYLLELQINKRIMTSLEYRNTGIHTHGWNTSDWVREEPGVVFLSREFLTVGAGLPAHSLRVETVFEIEAFRLE